MGYFIHFATLVCVAKAINSWKIIWKESAIQKSYITKIMIFKCLKYIDIQLE